MVSDFMSRYLVQTQIDLMPSLLSREVSLKPTVIQVLEHSFFHGRYRIPPIAGHEDTSFKF